MSDRTKPVLGIVGAGKVGVALARLATDAGYQVHIVASGTADDTARVTRYFAPDAVPADATDLPALADVLILAIPLHRFRELPLAAMDRHVVIDAMNYWPPINGALPEFDQPGQPSSTVVRDALPATARLVKTFNHLGYHQLDELPRPTGAANRAALAIAGDDPDAVGTVRRLVDDLGFDPVVVGGLAVSGALEDDSPIFGQGLTADEIRMALGIEPAA